MLHLLSLFSLFIVAYTQNSYYDCDYAPGAGIEPLTCCKISKPFDKKNFPECFPDPTIYVTLPTVTTISTTTNSIADIDEDDFRPFNGDNNKRNKNNNGFRGNNNNNNGNRGNGNGNGYRGNDNGFRGGSNGYRGNNNGDRDNNNGFGGNSYGFRGYNSDGHRGNNNGYRSSGSSRQINNQPLYNGHQGNPFADRDREEYDRDEQRGAGGGGGRGGDENRGGLFGGGNGERGGSGENGQNGGSHEDHKHKHHTHWYGKHHWGGWHGHGWHGHNHDHDHHDHHRQRRQAIIQIPAQRTVQNCAIECIFNQTNIIANDVFDRSIALEVYADYYPEIDIDLLTRTVDRCAKQLKNYQRTRLRRNNNNNRSLLNRGKGANKACHNGAGLFAACFNREVYRNCPVNLDNDDDDCLSLRTYIDNCAPVRGFRDIGFDYYLDVDADGNIVPQPN